MKMNFYQEMSSHNHNNNNTHTLRLIHLCSSSFDAACWWNVLRLLCSFVCRCLCYQQLKLKECLLFILSVAKEIRWFKCMMFHWHLYSSFQLRPRFRSCMDEWIFFCRNLKEIYNCISLINWVQWYWAEIFIEQ